MECDRGGAQRAAACIDRCGQDAPFAFPLMVERIREKLTTEKLSDRVARMIKDLERAAQLA